MRRTLFTVGVTLALACVLSGSNGTRANTLLSQQDVEPYRRRLEALGGANAMAYFRLAEDISDAAETDARRDLARHLFALSGAIDPHTLGRSACLALADLETDRKDRLRLLALATLLDQRGGVAWIGTNRTSANYGGAAALAVATAFSEYRAGRGQRALKSLEEPGAMTLLEAHDDSLPGGVRRFLEDCKLYRNERPPVMADPRLLRMLRLEQALLAGRDRAWSSDLMVFGGQTLIEVDPEHLDEALQVDSSLRYFRNGRWVALDARP